MHALIADFMTLYPECSFRALGAVHNRGSLELNPYGHPMGFLDAAEHPAWITRYHAANRARFAGPLSLPGWVLVDLYLMPAAIGLLTCPARLLTVRPEGLADDDEAIAAAYYAAPTVISGTVMGVSLISLREGIGGAALVKAMTLGMLRARVQRGITQFGNRSLRVHTRFGPVRIEGPVPAAHGLADGSFVYSVDVGDPTRLGAAMRRTPPAGPAAVAPPPTLPDGARWISVSDQKSLADVLRRAASGEPATIMPPGLSDTGEVLVRLGR